MDAKVFIAKRVAQELRDGDVVNLGIGLPTLVANYVPEGITVIFQSENGILGLGPAPAPGKEDKDIRNAGGGCVTAIPGAQFVNSADSFAAIRGGHVAMAVLGALQVDEEGNLANWLVPGKKLNGMGGAMDLVSGARQVVIAMEHTAKGAPKILRECTYPLTGKGVVKLIVTEMAVIRVTKEGLVLEEIAPGYTIEHVLAATEAKLLIHESLKVMDVGGES
ncbi:MAG TPA: 3-oxoacid CoA-transferase subunit B [Clostridia bacterium]|nr:3-oxoacid CoA-transferase subunit B [Clostridia bacterium]